jgi:hypothetical protein
MDIIKELKQVQIHDNDSVRGMIVAIKKEQENLEKKVYIFKAVDIVNTIDEMVKTSLKELYEQNIYGITISHSYNYDEEKQEFYLFPVDKDNRKGGCNNTARIKRGENFITHPQYLDLEELFAKYNGFGFAPKSCKYGNSESKIFMFSEGIRKDEIFNFLLNDELKSIFDYSQLQLSMSSDNKVQSKPYKI